MNLPPLNELEIAERERIVRELNAARHRRKNGMVMLRSVANGLRISRDTLYRKIKGYCITLEDLVNGKFPSSLNRCAVFLSLVFGVWRLVFLSVFGVWCLVFAPGCRSTPGEIKYNVPQFEYEQSSHDFAPMILPSAPAAAPSRTWQATWDAWNADPLTAMVLVQWSPTPDFRLQTLDFVFPPEVNSGTFATPVSAANFFRTGYQIKP